MASAHHVKSSEVVWDYYLANASVTPKLAPMDITYVQDPANDQYYSDISASLASGASLITLTNFAVNTDTGNSRVEFDFDNVSEASQTFTSNKFCIIFDTGTPATSPVFCTIEHTEVSPINGTYAVTINAEGLVQVSST